jgi:hypothetical protein
VNIFVEVCARDLTQKGSTRPENKKIKPTKQP